MDTLRRGILEYLAIARTPATAQTIAATVATHAEIFDVTNRLGYLVRAGAVVRHHNADGILRYELANAASDPSTFMAPVRPRPMHRRRTAPLAERILEAMGNKTMTAPQIADATGGVFTIKQVGNLLQLLKARGKVVKQHGCRNAEWTRVEAPSHQLAARRVLLTFVDADAEIGAITVDLTFDIPLAANECAAAAARAVLAEFETRYRASTVFSQRAG